LPFHQLNMMGVKGVGLLEGGWNREKMAAPQKETRHKTPLYNIKIDTHTYATFFLFPQLVILSLFFLTR
jgi:hypothetical protein